MKKIIIYLFLTIISLNSIAQRTLLRTDSAGFYADFYDLAKKNGRKGENVYKKLHSRWDSLYFSNNDKVKIIRNINQLLKKNAPLIPYISNYLEVIYAFNDIQHPINSYHQWNKGTEIYIKKAALSKLNLFFKTNVKTLKQNILYEKNNLSWYHTGNFVYVYKKRKLQAKFQKGELVGKIRNDSTVIHDTQGILYPMKNKWVATGGKVNWQKAGIAKGKRFVELTSYTIKLTNSYYKAEKTNLTDNLYKLASIDGNFSDKISSLKNPKKSSYPRFKSYREDLQISNILGYINFKGGIKIRGYKAIGFVEKAIRADLWLTRNKTVIAHFRARNFVFKDSTISSLQSSVDIKIDTSSLFHPGLNFKLIGHKLMMFRSKKGLAQSPFYDNFHQMDIFADIAEWDINQDKINFKNNITSSKGYVYLRSADFFDPNDPLLKGKYPKNPAIIIRDFGADEFKAQELARYMQKPTRQIVYMLLALSYKGLIEYDEKTQSARLLPRFNNYLEKLTGSVDYDNLQMASKPKLSKIPGAVYDLKKNELIVTSLLPVPISDKQQLIVRPTNDSLVFKVGRNFNFDGSFNIGYFGFKGKNFSFLYDDYKINLDSVDYMTIRVPAREGDSLHRNKNVKVLNVIEKIKGDILIDNPTNKSGLDSFPEYPILTSYDTSYVYYDKVVKPLGVYPRNKFYFQIYPYKIDSLRRFTTEKLKLLGEFHSDSIFPVFKNVDLVIQPDYSLGFNKPSSENGDTLYNGKGLFFNDLVLDSRGLNARGSIKYLNATVFSPHFNFFPDSMTTLAQKIEIKNQNTGFQFPDMVSASDSVFVQWYPDADSIWFNNVTNKKHHPTFKLYKQEATLQGKALMRPNGLTASGDISLNNGHFKSKNYTFKSRIFDADTASFMLMSDNIVNQNWKNKDSANFSTNNVQAHIDFDQRIAKLKSNGKDSYIYFPQNQYICYMSQMIWYIDKESLDLNSSTDTSSTVEALGAKFVSTNPKQDSLNFYATKSNYNAKEKLIKAMGVKKIEVANSLIKPIDGTVYIEKKAKIRTLDKASIAAQNFNFFNATISIFGKYELSGSGNYNYIDENDSVEVITMNSITVSDSLKVVIAKGKISKLQKFKLSPVYNYYGNVNILTSDTLAEYNGKLQLVHQCDQLSINPIPRPFYPFDAKLFPDSIIIPVTDVNHENAMYVGSVITSDSTHIYSTFLSPVNFWSDYPIIKSQGKLYYDKITHTFNVASNEKLKSPEARGTIYSLNKDYCNIYGQGDIALGVNYGQMKINAAGEFFHKIEPDKITLTMSFGLNFFFNQQCKDIIYNTLNQAPNLESVDLSDLSAKRNFIQLAEKSPIEQMYQELATDGEIKNIPKNLNKTFIFTNVKFNWNKETKSYLSDGPIGISFVDGKSVNKKVSGYIEFTKKKSGNLMNMYIEIARDKWFFFTFSRNVLKSYSSISEYNQIIKNLKDKERKMQVARNKTPFSFYLSSERVKNKFLFRVEPVEEDDGF